jgi:hypothetical protein
MLTTEETMAKKRGSGRRKTIKNRAGTLYAKRTSAGRFKEMDEKGRSLKADRRAKGNEGHEVRLGDRGDRRRRAA